MYNCVPEKGHYNPEKGQRRKEKKKKKKKRCCPEQRDPHGSVM